MAKLPNDHHHSPLSDAGAKSMKLRHFSPERREKGRGRREGNVDVKREEEVEETR